MMINKFQNFQLDIKFQNRILKIMNKKNDPKNNEKKGRMKKEEL